MDPANSERSRSREGMADVPQKPSRGHCCKLEEILLMQGTTIWRTTSSAPTSQTGSFPLTA